MRLVIVDGLDAVGKDTHGRLIAKYYEDKGEKVIIRSHPTNDSFFGRKTKKALLNEGKVSKIKASIFYMFDVLFSIRRYYNSKNNYTLIMVRYLMGTAYLPRRIVKYGYNFFEHFVPTSKYMFFLDASTESLLERVEEREEKEIFESKKELDKIRKKALLLTDKWFIIDTSGSVEDTFNKIKRTLIKLDENI
jgi:dTMP kinase